MSDALRHMAKGGKTFYFASMWLDRSVRNDAAIAYSFCRMVDDIADNLTPGEQRTTLLHGLLEAITTENHSHPKAEEMVELISRFPRIKAPVQDLIESCARDVPGLQVENESDLIRYSHGVAGTVGLIMYPILGGRASEGERYAADLGIAMQCTNIARDVLSDLGENRIYIPREWLAGADLQKLLKYDPLVETAVVAAVRRLLMLSDEYYTRGLQGLSYLAPRCRFAIRVAAACYAAIGERVILGNKLARYRAVVPLHAKLIIMLRSSNTIRRHPHYDVSESLR